MRTQIALLVVLSLVPASAQQPAGAVKKTPAKPAAVQSPLAKIVQMVEMKLPEAAVLNAIKSAGPLNPSADDFIRLKKAGASDNVIVALSGGEVPAAAAPVHTPAHAPSAAPAASPSSMNTDFATVSCARPVSSSKRVLAIDEFDYGTVRSQISAIFGTNVDLGKGILALLTKRLAEDGKYRIVERKNIQKVISEQDFGASNRVKQGTNAKIGRVQGADAILMGTITVFGSDTRKNNVNAGAITNGRLGGVLGSVNVGNRSDKAIVEISYRLIDAESSEVIAVGEARGESKRKSNGFGIAGFGNGNGGNVGTNMTSSNFQETIIGEATVDCINKLAAVANSKDQQVAGRSVEVEAKIAEIAGNKVYLAAGSNDGVQNCDRFEISRVIKEIKDPSTGEVLDLQTERIGDLLVVEVRDKISIAVFNGSSNPKVGYVAKKIM
ncbi:CsgG/HfaB family protein [Bryobacter aggregatus]|uniref:CsgG/HfaB family protein n=1 Tax=Bryobacter aggregatus TaxID=360054 RepID=UPI00068E2F4A|nr:CsgG/HfaB family protein [Bryobacter aggregatus]